MESGTGHIYNALNEQEIKGIKGDLVPWKIGEEVIIKGCKFEVKDIKTFPEDEILLKGKSMTEEEKFCGLVNQSPEEKPNKNYHKGLKNYLK